MSDYTELVKALLSASTVSTAWEKLMLDAAAAIDGMQAEVESKTKDAMIIINRLKGELWEAEHKQNEPKRGEWEREMDVNDEPFYQCSVCGECFDFNRDSTHEVFKYCPDCGAKMEVQHG